MSPLSVITAILQGGPRLSGTRMSPFWIFLSLRMMEVVMTTGAVRRAKLQTSIPTPNFLQAGCPSCHPTNGVKALKGKILSCHLSLFYFFYVKFKLKISLCVQVVREEDIAEFFEQLRARKRQKTSESSMQYYCKWLWYTSDQLCHLAALTLSPPLDKITVITSVPVLLMILANTFKWLVFQIKPMLKL